MNQATKLNEMISNRIAVTGEAYILDIKELGKRPFLHTPDGEVYSMPEVKDTAAEILKKENEWKAFEQRAAQCELDYQKYTDARNWQLADAAEQNRKNRVADAQFTKSQLENLKALEPEKLEAYIIQANQFIDDVSSLAIQPVKESIKTAEARLKAISSGKVK